MSGGLLAGRLLGAASLLTWGYLAVAHGRFWRPPTELPGGSSDPDRWPSVTVVVPARNEAVMLARTLPTIVEQAYPGRLRVLVVDDDSDDDTSRVAGDMAEVTRTDGPPAGWTGKVAAMRAGCDMAVDAEWILFTDADIAYPPGALTDLVRAAVASRVSLLSQMVRLRAETPWERCLVPAFVYFFAQLYPCARVNGPGRTAAAAGGCMLVRRAALEEAGGLARIKDALIDDVALGQLLKRRGRIWLGLSSRVVSVRAYPRLRDLWQMVARSAYTQLRQSPLLLAATVAGLLLTYAVPPAVTFAGIAAGDSVLAIPAATAWAIMALTYLPMLRFYGLTRWWAPALPAVALLYLGMTLDSARRHLMGRGGLWKGRAGARVSL